MERRSERKSGSRESCERERKREKMESTVRDPLGKGQVTEVELGSRPSKTSGSQG